MSNPKQTRAGRTAAAPEPKIEPGAAAESAAVPEDLDEAELAIAHAASAAAAPIVAAAVAAEPALDPPGTPGAARAGADVGAFASVRVLSLFSSANANNGWAYLDGIGWRRFATTNSSAHVNLGLLANGARAQGTPTPVRHESDNQIHEIYLW
ncbi:MAG TPA: hypothetical protein VFR67_23735 [Pilimelia sp.]|nr:hypothetical protein [Pilimelia sp.]